MIDELLESLLPEYERSTYNGDAAISTTKAQLLAEILKVIPKKITLDMNKYHHQTQIEGFNNAIEKTTTKVTELFNVEEK